MPDQPNKPAGDFDKDGKPRNIEDEQAVRNQGEVRPEDYPRDSGGRPGYGKSGDKGRKE